MDEKQLAKDSLVLAIKEVVAGKETPEALATRVIGLINGINTTYLGMMQEVRNEVATTRKAIEREAETNRKALETMRKEVQGTLEVLQEKASELNYRLGDSIYTQDGARYIVILVRGYKGQKQYLARYCKDKKQHRVYIGYSLRKVDVDAKIQAYHWSKFVPK